MKKFFRKIFGSYEEETKKDFSTFFTTASEREKSDLLRKVVREANEDQKRLMDEVGKTLSNEKHVRV
jgi:hypothetical protein